MQLRQLHHFEALYRLRSFTRAAQDQFVTQSALSRSIRALEDELQQPLFDRSTHDVEPTAAADLLIAHAKDAIAATRALEDTATVLRGGGGGSVRIGTGPYPAQPLLTRVIRSLSLEHPGLRVAVVGGAAADLWAALIRRQLDFVVCDTSKLDDSPFAADIEVIALPGEPLVLVVGEDHPLAASDDVDAGDVAAHPWVLPPPTPYSLRALTGTGTGLSGATFPHYELEATATCLEVVRDGRTVTLIPLSLALAECAARGLVFRLIGPAWVTRDGIHVLGARSRSASAQLAVDATVKEATAIAEAGRTWVDSSRPGWIRARS